MWFFLSRVYITLILHKDLFGKIDSFQKILITNKEDFGSIWLQVVQMLHNGIGLQSNQLSSPTKNVKYINKF